MAEGCWGAFGKMELGRREGVHFLFRYARTIHRRKAGRSKVLGAPGRAAAEVVPGPGSQPESGHPGSVDARTRRRRPLPAGLDPAMHPEGSGLPISGRRVWPGIWERSECLDSAEGLVWVNWGQVAQTKRKRGKPPGLLRPDSPPLGEALLAAMVEEPQPWVARPEWAWQPQQAWMWVGRLQPLAMLVPALVDGR